MGGARDGEDEVREGGGRGGGEGGVSQSVSHEVAGEAAGWKSSHGPKGRRTLARSAGEAAATVVAGARRGGWRAARRWAGTRCDTKLLLARPSWGWTACKLLGLQQKEAMVAGALRQPVLATTICRDY